jgi:hypothetical protein
MSTENPKKVRNFFSKMRQQFNARCFYGTFDKNNCQTLPDSNRIIYQFRNSLDKKRRIDRFRDESEIEKCITKFPNLGIPICGLCMLI